MTNSSCFPSLLHSAPNPFQRCEHSQLDLSRQGRQLRLAALRLISLMEVDLAFASEADKSILGDENLLSASDRESDKVSSSKGLDRDLLP